MREQLLRFGAAQAEPDFVSIAAPVRPAAAETLLLQSRRRRVAAGSEERHAFLRDLSELAWRTLPSVKI